MNNILDPRSRCMGARAGKACIQATSLNKLEPISVSLALSN